MTRGRRTWLTVILVVAIITGFGAVISTWVKRQVLDTHNYSNMSGKLIEDKKIQAALSDYLVNEVFTNVDVAAELRSALPAQLQGVAAPIAGGLRQVAEQTAPKVLAQPSVQEGFKKANEAAHAQLIKILNGGGPNVSTQNGVVTLNLHNAVDRLAQQLGIEDKVAAARSKLPPTSGELTIMKADQIKTAQNIAKGIKGISILLTILSLGLFGVMIVLSRDQKRLALRRVGWSFFGIGIACLLLRRIAGNNVVDGLAATESVKVAAHNAWNITTSLLYTISVSMVIYGLFLVVCAWLAGEMPLAIALRHRLAPTLRDRPGLAYGAVGAAYLVVLLWGPTPAFRNLVPIVLIGALLAVGVEALRHQAAREFPGATSDDAGHALGDWWDARRHHGAAPATLP